MTTRHAVALRLITHADETHPEGSVIRSMPAQQFTEWESAGMVRAATKDDLAAVDDLDPAARAALAKYGVDYGDWLAMDAEPRRALLAQAVQASITPPAPPTRKPRTPRKR